MGHRKFVAGAAYCSITHDREDDRAKRCEGDQSLRGRHGAFVPEPAGSRSMTRSPQPRTRSAPRASSVTWTRCSRRQSRCFTTGSQPQARRGGRSGSAAPLFTVAVAMKPHPHWVLRDRRSSRRRGGSLPTRRLGADGDSAASEEADGMARDPLARRLRAPPAESVPRSTTVHLVAGDRCLVTSRRLPHPRLLVPRLGLLLRARGSG